jgi:PAS domain S-box-containing protein
LLVVLAAFFAAIAVFASEVPLASAQSPRVLVLNSYHPGYNWSDGEQAGLLQTLARERPDILPNVEYLDMRRFPGEARAPALLAQLQEKYGRQTFDLIVALDDPAVSFVLEHRDRFGTAVPIVFGGLNDVDVTAIRRNRAVTGVAQTYDYAGTLALIQRLQPGVRKIVAVSCLTETGLACRRAMEKVVAKNRPPFEFTWLDDWTVESLLGTVGQLPDDTVVLLLSIARAERGRVLIDDPVFGAELAGRSSVPVYFVTPPMMRKFGDYSWETAVWHGMGGSLMASDLHGERIGQLALRVLRGEAADTIPIVEDSPSRVAFDYRQLQRFGIAESSLPKGAEVFHAPPTFYQVHRSRIVAGIVAIAVLAATVLLLVWIILLRRRAELALRRSHEHFQMMARATNDAVWDWDLVAGSLWWNESYTEQLRLPPDVTMNIATWENHVHPDDRAWFLQSIRKRTDAGETRRVLEYRVLRSDGQVRHVLDRICIARGADGGATRVLGARIDLTDRMQAEQERRRLAAAVEQSATATVLFDPDGAVRFVNPAFGRATGMAAPRQIKEICAWFRPEEGGATMSLDGIQAAVTREGHWSARLTGTRSDGVVCLMQLAVYPIRDRTETISCYVLVGQDITREAKLEDQVRLSQKMEAVGMLAGGIAHDFNNLLQVIGGFAQQAQEAPDAEERAECLAQVREAGARAVQLTRQLLVFSREDQTGKLVDIDLNELLARQIKMLRRLLDAGVELVLSPAATPTNIVGDPGQLEQVFMNLCINARDAMPRGGRITLEISEMRLDVDYCTAHPWARPGHFVQVAVTDTGVGMDRATLARIFDPFFTTKPKDKGTGLGLAVVYGIVQRHAGLIHVYSEPGVGTTFRIFLPVQARGTVVGAPEVATAPREGRGTILVAEDDPSVRKLAERVLEKAGYTVLTSGDGAQALELFRRDAAAIDLVVLDAVLPTLSGREVYDEVRRLDPHKPVLFCSGYTPGTIQAEFFPGDEVRMLGKPYAPNALLDCVATLLAKKNS